MQKHDYNRFLTSADTKQTLIIATHHYYTETILLHRVGLTVLPYMVFNAKRMFNVISNALSQKNSGKVKKKSIRKLNLVIRFTLKGFASLIRNLISSCHLSLIQQIFRSHGLHCVHTQNIPAKCYRNYIPNGNEEHK